MTKDKLIPDLDRPQPDEVLPSVRRRQSKPAWRRKAWSSRGKWPVGWVLFYSIALLLAWIRPGDPAVTFVPGMVLLIAEGINWWRAMRTGPVDLAMPFRVLSLLTMWVGPALAELVRWAPWFNGDVIQVPFVQYAMLALPGTVALNLALHLGTRRGAAATHRLAACLPSPRLLAGPALLAALLATLSMPLADGVWRQPVHLVSQLVYPGLMLAISGWPARRGWFLAAGAAYAASWAVRSTYFGDLLFWTFLLLWHAGAFARLSRRGRRAVLALGLLGLFALLTVKYELRRALWALPPDSPDRGAAVTRLLLERVRDPRLLVDGETISTIVNRFNQGFYTAQAMAHTPHHEPFARGETLWNAVRGALLPRWLDPDKPGAGGYAYMQRFAGRVIEPPASYNIGFYGEAYVNFGIAGAWLVLAAYGFIFMLAQHAVRLLGTPWIPYLLLPAIQVETDFGIALNHFVKAGVIVAGLLAVVMVVRRARNLP